MNISLHAPPSDVSKQFYMYSTGGPPSISINVQAAAAVLPSLWNQVSAIVVHTSEISKTTDGPVNGLGRHRLLRNHLFWG